MDQTLTDLPRLRRPAVVNAAQYWLAPEQFARHCQRLGDRFLVPMPATGPWLCLTDPEDIKRIFTADTGVLASERRWRRRPRTISSSARRDSRTSTAPSTCAGGARSSPRSTATR